MRAKEYLYQLKDIDRAITTQLEEIGRLRTLATHITSTIKEDVVQTNHAGDKIGDTVCKIAELEDKINDMIDEYADIKRDSLAVIKEIRPIVLGTVLTKYYLQNKTFEQVAIEMGKTFQWIHKLHGRALKEFEKKYQELIEIDKGSVL